MRTLLGLLLLTLAGGLLVLELVALADPAQTALATDGDPFAPPPWYVHALWFAAIGATGWMAALLLRGGILGRLVRGRGLTPEPVRR